MGAVLKQASTSLCWSPPSPSTVFPLSLFLPSQDWRSHLPLFIPTTLEAFNLPHVCDLTLPPQDGFNHLILLVSSQSFCPEASHSQSASVHAAGGCLASRDSKMKRFVLMSGWKWWWGRGSLDYEIVFCSCDIWYVYAVTAAFNEQACENLVFSTS